MNRLPFKKVLALSPHTDDIEFGCGGTLHRLLQQGSEIYSAVFSLCEESVPEGYPSDVLLTEMHRAAEVVGIRRENIFVFHYPVRKFPERRQDILEDLIKLKLKIEPDLLLTPARNDIHQDHAVITAECVRAFRYHSIFAYELPWNNINFVADALIELSAENIAVKSQAIACYKSQEFRHYSRAELFRSYASLRGVQNKTELAEAFEVIRLSL